jgi:uncharacterized protein DUF222/HNH endonuclease
MSTLRSGLEELETEDLGHRSDGELVDDFMELERSARVLEAERMRRLAEIDRRGAFKNDGYLCLSSWLAHRLRMGFAAACQQVREAGALQEMPQMREALASGELSSTAVRDLVSARQANPSEFGESEGLLVDAARRLSARDLRKALAYWRQAADAKDAARDADRAFERRRLHMSSTMFGMVRIDGDLDPEGGQVVMTALKAMQDAQARTGRWQDGRKPTQRRADALVELSRQWLDRSDRPEVAGERPHLSVLTGVEALGGHIGGTCELEDVGVIHPESVRRLACDASVARVVLGPASEPLDVGRRTPVVPAALRRVVVIRDRGCRFPGCDRPPGWCDAHHVRHWADGGETSLGNLLLLCRRHHRMVHGEFRLEMQGGKPVFRRPDGSLLEDRAPP